MTFERLQLFGMNSDVATLASVVDRVKYFCSHNNGSNYICLSNVHMCVLAENDDATRAAINQADLVLADGYPINLYQKFLGHGEGEQIRGFDLTYELLRVAEAEGISVGFFGGSDEHVLEALKVVVSEKWPRLRVVFMRSPPHGTFVELINDSTLQEIADVNPQILFVGLGCPKQELWMQSVSPRVSCCMIGVGAVFDFLAGTKRQAPRLMRRLGLEWLFRLITEPRRLFRRYVETNTRFLYLLIAQQLSTQRKRRE